MFNIIRNLQIWISILETRNLRLPKPFERHRILGLEIPQLLGILQHAVKRFLPAEALDLVAQLVAGEIHEVLSQRDRKSTRLNSSHMSISYAVFCLKKKKNT